MPEIRGSLSVKLVNDALKAVREYKTNLNQKIQDLLKAIMEHGLEVARAKCIDMHINDSGHLLSTINGYFDGALKRAVIRVDCNYAVFVEFGTGTKGENSPYPAAEIMNSAGYVYNGGTHHTTVNGIDGWWYYNDKLQRFVFTNGYQSRPFMYETAQELHDWLKGL